MDRFCLKRIRKNYRILQTNWTEREINTLAKKLEETLSLIAQNPSLYQVSDIKKEIRRVVILKHNTLYYRFVKNHIEIISFVSNRQNPQKRKLSGKKD